MGFEKIYQNENEKMTPTSLWLSPRTKKTSPTAMEATPFQKDR